MFVTASCNALREFFQSFFYFVSGPLSSVSGLLNFVSGLVTTVSALLTGITYQRKCKDLRCHTSSIFSHADYVYVTQKYAEIRRNERAI